MGIGVSIPQELWLKQNELQRITAQKHRTGDYDGTFTPEFINEVLAQTEALEAFIRRECIEKGNYIVDPNMTYTTNLRFTGQLLIWLEHNMQILILSRINTSYWISRMVAFANDIESYLKSEAIKDGSALMVLFYNSKIPHVTGNSDLGYQKYSQAYNLSYALDPEQLDWVSSTWIRMINGEEVIQTPEAVKAVSKHYFNAYREYMYLYFNESAKPENFNKLYNAFETWVDAALTNINNPEIIPDFCAFMQYVTPERWSFFEKAIASVWFSKTTSDMNKLNLLYGYFAAQKFLDKWAMNAGGPYNYERVDAKNGVEVMTQVRGWLANSFIHELGKNDAAVIENFIARMKAINFYDEFIADLNASVQGIQNIAHLYNENLSVAIANLKEISDDTVKLVFSNLLRSCGLTAISNEVMMTLANQELAEYVSLEENQEVAYVLTASVSADVETLVKTVHNSKTGTAKATVDINGRITVHNVQIDEFYSEFALTLTSPAVITVGSDVTFITIK